MDKEELLLRSVADLIRKLSSFDDYEVLKSAGIIRLLLIDGGKSLSIQLATKHRLKLFFMIVKPTIIEVNPTTAVVHQCDIGSLDPVINNKGLVSQLTLDQFLQITIGYTEKHTYTVRDAVLLASNVMGGVHAGHPNDDKTVTMMEINSEQTSTDLPTVLHQVKVIGRIVIKGLLPLSEKITTVDKYSHLAISQELLALLSSGRNADNTLPKTELKVKL